MQKQSNYAIIVAGGNGSRMKSEVPKQFLLLHDKPLLMYTLECFYNTDKAITIILALPASQITYWKELCEKYAFTTPHKIVQGGETRFHSVKNALNTIMEDDGIVAVHDGVRPLVSEALINACFQGAVQHSAVVPAVAVSDSLRLLEGNTNRAVDRRQYRAVQTPQCFLLSLLKKAYEQAYTTIFTDDSAVVEASGHRIMLVEGEAGNIKITTPEDLLMAAILMRK